MARYRRSRTSRGQDLAAAAGSLVLGASVAVVSFYVVRLFLSREELSPRSLPSRKPVESFAPSDGATRGPA